MPAKTLYFRDNDVYLTIQRIAKLQGIAASQLIEELLIEYINNYTMPTVCPTCGKPHDK